MESAKSTFYERNALDEEQLKKWCSANNLAYHMCELKDLDNCDSRYSFIFTGATPNHLNDGHDHHWLFLDGNLVFDSYGKTDYQLPSHFQYLKNEPKQLQNYNSTVCGEYCCLFYKFLTENASLSPEEIGEAFSHEFGLTNNRQKNDQKILSSFNASKKAHNASKTTDESSSSEDDSRA